MLDLEGLRLSGELDLDAGLDERTRLTHEFPVELLDPQFPLPMLVAFNSKLLIEALASGAGDRVEFALQSNASKPVTLQYPASEFYVQVVMPIVLPKSA
jgi:DNA polymerase III sliding clamp (beta) subunit (PCNA family)